MVRDFVHKLTRKENVAVEHQLMSKLVLFRVKFSGYQTLQEQLNDPIKYQGQNGVYPGTAYSDYSSHGGEDVSIQGEEGNFSRL